MAVTFRAVLNESTLEVPADVLAALGASAKRPAVRVTINGVELRTTIAVYGGKSYVGLRREMRDKMQVASGETLDVLLALDADERRVELPPEIGELLTSDPDARQRFEALSYTNQREYVDWATGAKRAATREQRLGRFTELLKSGRRTPLG